MSGKPQLTSCSAFNSRSIATCIKTDSVGFSAVLRTAVTETFFANFTKAAASAGFIVTKNDVYLLFMAPLENCLVLFQDKLTWLTTEFYTVGRIPTWVTCRLVARCWLDFWKNFKFCLPTKPEILDLLAGIAPSQNDVFRDYPKRLEKMLQNFLERKAGANSAALAVGGSSKGLEGVF